MRRHYVFLGFIIFLLSCEKNHAPEIVDVSYSPKSGMGGTIFTFSVQAVDKDRDPLTYQWTADTGDFMEGSTMTQVKWEAPISMASQAYSISVSISDGVESITRTTVIQVGKTEFGSVSGHVYYKGFTIPIAGVAIEISEKTATSDTAGNFSISEVPVGILNLVAKKPDYDSFIKEVTIVRNKNTEIVVYLTSSRYSTKVSGTVRGNYSGNGQAGVSVLVLNPDGVESDLKTTTGSNGFYQLLSVPHGQRKIVVMVSGEIVFTGDVFLSDPEEQFDIDIPEPFKFTDSRDGNSYQALKIGNQGWMIENLAYLPAVSRSGTGSDTEKQYYVYGYEGTSISEAKNSSNYQQFGVLYNWEAAKSSCPEGWRLPTDGDWKILEGYLGMSLSDVDTTGWRNSGNIGKKLKSKSSWNSNGYGDNSSGFNVFLGGIRYYYGGFGHLNEMAYLWSSTENGSSSVWGRFLYYAGDGVYRSKYYRGNGFSARCLKKE